MQNACDVRGRYDNGKRRAPVREAIEVMVCGPMGIPFRLNSCRFIMFTQIHPGPIFWMAKLVNHLQGGMSGTQKKFSLLVKRKLYQGEYEITLKFMRFRRL
jgi:hypothetical protein